MEPSQILSGEELKLLNVAYGKEREHFAKSRYLFRDWMAIMLMLEAGLRVGECAKLKLNDVYLNYKPRDRIIVRAEYTKTGHERILPITARIRQLLDAGALWHYRLMGDYIGDPLLFSRSADTPILVRSLQKMIARRFNNYVGRPIHPHLLRHTFATLTLRYSDLKTTQYLLGHSSITSTNVYLHSDPLRAQTAVDKAFDGGDNPE